MIRASFSGCRRPMLSLGGQGMTTTLPRTAVGVRLSTTLQKSFPFTVQTPLPSIRVAWKHSASNKARKKKHQGDQLGIYFEQLRGESKPKQRLHGAGRRKNKKKVLPAFEHTTKAPNGRRVLMTAHLSEERLAKWVKLDKHSANNVLSRLKHNLRLELTKSHSAEGPSYDELFYSYSKIHMPAAVVSCLREGNILRPHIAYATMESDGSMVFHSAGAARSKKQAEWFALLDTLSQLDAMGFNIEKPPNMNALFKAQEEEKHKQLVQRSQMLLEMCHVSRPYFSYEEATPGYASRRNGDSQHTATMSFYVQGRRIEATGSPAVNKAQAQGNATIEAAVAHLPVVVGQDRIDKYQSLIDSSSDGHVSALRIPRLPDELRGLLKEALGDGNEDFLARSLYLKNAQAAYHKSKSVRHGNQRDSRGQGQSRSLSDHQRINKRLMALETQRRKRVRANPDGIGGKTQAIRDALPITALQENLIKSLRRDAVVVVSGGTGSGKSTQCPQYILEDAILNGRASETRIIVTQPRRIAAISVAERIAFERGERIGDSVGYSVRFRRQPPRNVGGSIEFVTTGVLLRRIINDPALDGISHVVIDEVHERDIDTDFLLVLLRDLVKRRPDLRVVLMSATLDADSFAAYFERRYGDEDKHVPTMGVPAKPRHPVEIVHLEDLSGESTKAQEGDEWPQEIVSLSQSLLECQDRQIQRELIEADMEEEASGGLKRRAQREDEGGVSLDSDSEHDSDEESKEMEASVAGSTPSRAAMLRKAVEARSSAVGEIVIDPSISAKDDDKEIGEVTVALVARLAQYIAKLEIEKGRKGSILCFLPGWDEIKEAMSLLELNTELALRQNMTLLPLHSTIPQDDQQKVFIPADDGKVKVILATNIAESSVTIDDVLAVVDSGLVREMNYNPDSAMSTMETVPISRASATQRLGRAGRVAPGKCYRLYAGAALHAMNERSVPEIQRTALEATCLQTCSMTDIGVNKFLQDAMDPPSYSSVQHAMNRLQALGAINLDQNSKKEQLSPLGNILSQLPLDPAMGRMLVIACVMKCLDPILTAVATFSSRDVFYTPLQQREEQKKARQSFCKDSDLMASVRAYDYFQSLIKKEGWGSAREWAADNFVSLSAMTSIASVRSQLLSELSRIGLIPRDDLSGRRSNRTLVDGADVNQNARSEYLQVALWASGFPDSLASRRKLGHFGTLRTRTENHAGLHPSSVLFHRKPPEDRSVKLPEWFLYREMIQSSQVFLRGCTDIQPEQIALFGGNVLNTVGTVEGVNSTYQLLRVLDDWILLDGPCQESLELLAQARSEINDAMQLKFMNPAAPIPESSQKILNAVCQLFTVLGGEMDSYMHGNDKYTSLPSVDPAAENAQETRMRQLMNDFLSPHIG